MVLRLVPPGCGIVAASFVSGGWGAAGAVGGGCDCEGIFSSPAAAEDDARSVLPDAAASALLTVSSLLPFIASLVAEVTLSLLPDMFNNPLLVW